MADQATVRCTVNGEAVEARVPPHMLLADFLRHELKLTGTHVGCEMGVCGACTVKMDDRPVRSCLTLAAQAEGTEIETVEGLSGGDHLHPLQEALREHHGLQCGFCTPGILMTMSGAFEQDTWPATEAEARDLLSGNICRCTGYQHIVDAVLSIDPDGRAKPGDKTSERDTSTSPHRKEDARLLAGRARFTDDVHLDRMAHAVFVRSPIAHGEILSIDKGPALEAGALAVLTADDLPFIDSKLISRFWHPSIRGGTPWLLARKHVRYVGEAVAMLVAEDAYQAEDLAALVEVVFNPLPVAASMDASLASEAPQLHDDWPDNVAAEFDHVRGDAKAAMEEATNRLRRRFTFGRQMALPLETRGCVADFDRDRNRLDIWISTQVHYNVRNNLAEILGLPEDHIQVHAEDVGGGFGGKSRPYAEEIIVSHASAVLGRPVEWIEDRMESLLATTQSRGTETKFEIGFDETGRILALTGELLVDLGAYVFTSGIVTAQVASGQCAGPYKIENIDLNVRCIGTNKTPLATYRGAGQPEAAFPLECLLDLVAEEVGISAEEVRLRNIVAPEDLPYDPFIPYGGTAVELESGDFPKIIRRTVAESGYSEEVETFASGENAAWGLACGMESTGFVGLESARVCLDPSGKLIVSSGMTSQGQGQITTYAQICANIMDVPLDDVDVQLGNTGLLPFGRGAFASRGAVVGGNAVAGAAEKLKARVLGLAGTLLQCEGETLSIREGHICRQDGAETELTLGAIAAQSLPGGPLNTGQFALEEDYIYDTGGSLTLALSVHAAKVVLDPKTGFYRIAEYFILHDTGKMLNPKIVEGQIIGGAVDGMGCTMLSQIRHDENGQLLTGSLMDYLVMAAPEAPRVYLSHMETTPTTNPLGVRGVGEGGVIPAPPAITNALRRIISQRPGGKPEALLHLPLGPEEILESLQD